MAERPVLFSGPMVRAILEGRKTQTRRLLRRQPPSDTARFVNAGARWYHQSAPFRLGDLAPGASQPDAEAVWVAGQGMRCPYGVPGDRLWVRETWRPVSPEWAAPDGGPIIVRYAADGVEHMHGEARIGDWRWPVAARRGDVPGIHMPRWASRIDLEIVGVRVERLQDLTRADALAEGVEALDRYHEHLEFLSSVGGGTGDAEIEVFRSLWNEINGDRATWESNPWIWRVEFKRVQP